VHFFFHAYYQKILFTDFRPAPQKSCLLTPLAPLFSAGEPLNGGMGRLSKSLSPELDGHYSLSRIPNIKF
jgi:hypothetical protein